MKWYNEDKEEKEKKEVSMEQKKYRYDVEGMSCAACVAHVERAAEQALTKKMGKEKDSYTVTVSLLTSSMSIEVKNSTKNEWEKKELDAALQQEVERAGYKIYPSSDQNQSSRAKEKEEQEKNDIHRSWLWFFVSALITLTLMVFSMGHMVGFEPIRQPVVLALFQLILTLPVLVIHRKYFIGGFNALIHGSPNMDSLIAIGSGASFLYGLFVLTRMMLAASGGQTDLAHAMIHDLYFESSAMIVTLVSLGKNMEKGAKMRASSAIRKLATMMPETAILLQDGEEKEVLIDTLKKGDVVFCKEGTLIPVDGVIVKGEGSINEAALTGESIPADKKPGDHVHAACTLVEGSLTVRAEQVGKETALSHILRLIEDAAASRAPVARMADKISRVFVPVVLLISLVTFILWMIIEQDITRALQFSISVMVISCPCALGLATPTAILVATGRGAERGILFKSAEALEKLHSIGAVALDKTGTMTEGQPEVTDVVVFEGDEAEIVLYAASVERHSAHPLSLAICRRAQEMQLSYVPTSDFVSVVGEGVSARVGQEEKICLIGKQTLLEKNGIQKEQIAWFEQVKNELGLQGQTVVCVAVDGQVKGAIALADRIRPDTKNALERLSHMGVRSVMLTGDNETVAAAVAKRTGVADVRASLLPGDKESAVRALCEGTSVAMVGDGINDAPALARADVGIAIGAGTDVAIDCADVVLTGNNLHGVADAIALSRRTMLCIKENLFWALVYNSVCIPVAAGFLSAWGIVLDPMLASAAMSLSSVCVVVNSLRLRRANLMSVAFKAKHQSKKIKNKKENHPMEQMNTEVLSIKGMMCQHCVAHVKQALEGVSGVVSVQVSLENAQATVKAQSHVKRADLVAAVVAQGYECE